jgi:hypothetical protein
VTKSKQQAPGLVQRPGALSARRVRIQEVEQVTLFVERDLGGRPRTAAVVQRRPGAAGAQAPAGPRPRGRWWRAEHRPFSLRMAEYYMSIVKDWAFIAERLRNPSTRTVTVRGILRELTAQRAERKGRPLKALADLTPNLGVSLHLKKRAVTICTARPKRLWSPRRSAKSVRSVSSRWK